MNATIDTEALALSEAEAAKIRITRTPGDPLLFADWVRVVFFHFALPPDLLRESVPAPLELETHEGRGIVSLVAVTMRRFRAARLGPGVFMRPVIEQRFLNLRTYARWRKEAGAVFLWGWLSRPFGLLLPNGRRSPYSFADIRYEHAMPDYRLRGEVTEGKGRFAYSGTIATSAATPCAPGSLAAFALERYTGFFHQGKETRLFRAWHPVWQQVSVRVTIEERSLIEHRFPWFRQAQFLEANFAPGFERVWLGRPHRLDKLMAETRKDHKRLKVFFDMP